MALADQAQARLHFERGKTYFEVDDYRKAIEEFKAAHVEKADPAFLYNIAECYRHLGETREALVFYRRFLSLSPANDRTRPTVERRIAELQALPDPTVTAQAEPPPESDRVSAIAPPRSASLPPPLPPTASTAPAATTLITEPGASDGNDDRAKPVYTRGWFIAAVGLAVVAGAVGIWALSRSPAAPDTPLGNQRAFP